MSVQNVTSITSVLNVAVDSWPSDVVSHLACGLMTALAYDFLADV